MPSNVWELKQITKVTFFGQGLKFFHIENWYSIYSVIRTLFKLTGLVLADGPMPCACRSGTTISATLYEAAGGV